MRAEGCRGGLAVGAETSAPTLASQQALQIIQSMYSEGSQYNSFECQTFPPGLRAFSEIATHGNKADQLVDAGIENSIMWSAYSARL